MEPGMKWFRLKHTLRAGMRPIPLLFVLLGIGLCHMKRWPSTTRSSSPSTVSVELTPPWGFWEPSPLEKQLELLDAAVAENDWPEGERSRVSSDPQGIGGGSAQQSV